VRLEEIFAYVYAEKQGERRCVINLNSETEEQEKQSGVVWIWGRS